MSAAGGPILKEEVKQGDPNPILIPGSLSLQPQAALGTGPVAPDSGSWMLSGVFFVLIAMALFKAIHKILRYVHDEDIRQRESEPRLYDNPIKEQIRNPKNLITKFKDDMFDKTLESFDKIDNAAKNGAVNFVEKGIKPAFEAVGNVELGKLGRRSRLGMIPGSSVKDIGDH